MLYEFKRGSNATVAANNINATYGEVISARTCQDWFSRFRSGDLSLGDRPRSGRPSIVDNDVLTALVEEDPRQTLEELAERLGCGQTTVWDHLQQIGKVNRSGVWVPHELTPENKALRTQICNSLIIRNKKDPFLKWIVTGDEKWVLYENPRRQNQWLSPGQTPVPVAKPGLHPKKALLCVWWDYRGIIHFELLEMGQTITADIYCQQLDRLRDALAEKRPALLNRNKLILHQDNARPHTAKLTQQKIRALGWEVLPHPPYSPDIAPSDYHLFQSLQHYLSGKTFADLEALRNGLADFFAQKPDTFYAQGIDNLVERWGHVVDNDGEYIID
jgi:histone-lysine N-methyltransferase SETMAR